MKAEKQINDWFAKFEHRMHNDVPRIIARTALTYFQDNFEKQSWDGVPWQPLKPSTLKRKGTGKKILSDRRNLFNSMRVHNENPDRVTIRAGNSKVPYARIHNEGLTARGTAKVRPFTNRNFMGKGKPVRIKAHTRAFNFTMPRRQFMGHSRFLNAILKERLIQHFNK